MAALECCGCLQIQVHGDQAEILFHECVVIVRTVACRAHHVNPAARVARLTAYVKREITRILEWSGLDEDYAVGECRIKLLGWNRARRFVVVRRESKASVGGKLFEWPEYTFRVFVTSLSAAPEEIWRDYNHRADRENRIAELKHDLNADRFCLKNFHATGAAFRSILLLLNLLSKFRSVTRMPWHKEPGSLRSEVFLCAAELKPKGDDLILSLSTGWGRLRQRISMLSSILTWVIPITPKLNSVLVTWPLVIVSKSLESAHVGIQVEWSSFASARFSQSHL